jgi:hypothetical protein
MARLTLRLTCCDSLAREEKTSTITRLSAMARAFASSQSAPGATSRGAIQQRMPLDSSAAQTASATALSFEL